MIATLTFTLPDEEAEFSAALAGGKWRCLVWDLDNWLRGEGKYAQEPPPGTVTPVTLEQWQAAAGHVRHMLRTFVTDNDLTLE